MTWKMTAFILAIFAQGQEHPVPRQIDNETPADIQMQLIAEAAPADVAQNASTYILEKDGYRLARKGSNGFTCLIAREHKDTLEPECYDAEGSATLLATDLYLEQQRAKGVPDETIRKAIAEGYRSGRFKGPSKPGIVYMLSPHNRVFDPESGRIISFPGHLMFYAPYATAKTVGSGEGAPYIVHPGEPDALMIVVPAQSHQH